MVIGINYAVKIKALTLFGNGVKDRPNETKRLTAGGNE